MGGVSVNSLCQQDGLFALSVYRHSVLIYYALGYTNPNFAYNTTCKVCKLRFT